MYFFPDNHNKELIKIIEHRKQEINHSYNEIIEETSTLNKDSTITDDVKKLAEEDIRKIKKSKKELDTLVAQQINAYKENNDVLAYELRSQIHAIPKKYDLNLKDSTTSEFSEKIANLFMEKMSYMWGIQKLSYTEECDSIEDCKEN